MVAGGVDEARERAAALIDERRRVGCGFGLDELWQPDGGWEQANREARDDPRRGGASLMALNPVRFTRSVTEEFRRYQLTAFPIADPRLAAQASALLGAGAFRASPLTKGPYVSLARALAQGASLAISQPRASSIRRSPGSRSFRSSSLTRSRRCGPSGDGKNALVSTGTGSGKTESFLFPIIDHCLRLRDEGAEEGLVAVLVYPMNALASDQRDRLRLLLAGTGITYGMYVGSTPANPGERVSGTSPRVQGRDALVDALRRRRANDEDVVPFEECASEHEIRERKPRILITNANQLELLLTRQKDFELFTGAPLRFVVLDEAHTYSGATGAEVACLVRRLRAFAGKSADEVTCIATSATIVDPERGSRRRPRVPLAAHGRWAGVRGARPGAVRASRVARTSDDPGRARRPLCDARRRPLGARCPACRRRPWTRRPASTETRSPTRSPR